MGRSPLILASLAKAALPEVDFRSARELTNNHSGAFDAVLLEDAHGEHFVVRMPNGQRASLDLETEIQALRALNPALRQTLPFQVPQLVGESRDSKGPRAVLFDYVYGESTDVSSLNGDHALASSIGQALAAIHQLPISLVEAAGLPQYTPAEYVKFAVSRLDRAAATGRVPATLLQRWESALEDVNLFRYTPTVVQGDIQAETMLRSGNEISGILSWGGLQVSDPAKDFQWLASAAHPDFLYSVLLAYQNGATVDNNLRQRAALYGEMEYANWLVDATARGDLAEVEDAATVLQNLAIEIENGQAESVDPTPLNRENAMAFSAVATNDDYLLDSSREAREYLGAPLGSLVDDSAPTRPIPVVPESIEDENKAEGELF